jgi:tetratricopeptide (TPR) repeat protein
MNTRERTPADPAAILKGLAEAGAHADAGRADQAAQVYRGLERAFPRDIRAPYSLAVIDLGQGRLARARRRLEAVTALAPDHMPAQHNLGAVRQQLGDWPGAATAYQAAVALAPEAIAPRQALAAALTILGRTAAALEHYRVLAEVPAARWAALTRMALIDAGSIDEAMLADMRSAVADRRLDPELRTGLLFALGEVLERRGEYDQAFAAFAEGNRRKRGSLRPSAQEAAVAHAAAADHVRSRFTADFIAAHAGRGSRSTAPIFVVGFPRSGSTLIEQILASHPDVQGLGEMGVLPRLLERGYPAAGDISAARLRDLADAYLKAARTRGWNGKSRFVDKTLENYLHVGMIHLAFPHATVLEAQRDPLDVGLSCFRQLFTSGNETLYDLTDIGAEHRRYGALMAHWREVLPGRVGEISHEALVADPESEIRALVAAPGLSWDPAVSRFFEREGAVRTASAAQVRRPIFSGSVARWRRYQAHLAPLKAALGA